MKGRYKELVKEKRVWYKKIGRVWCPVLNQFVIFNSKGFYHLRYDSFGKERDKQEQKYKLSLLPLVIPVIKQATSVHDYKKDIYSRPLNKGIEIWELKEFVGKQKALVSVVLRRVGSGNITFFSVWKKKVNKANKKPLG